MPSPTGPDVTEGVVFLVLIVALLARRTYRLVTGVRYASDRLAVFAGFYVFLFAALAFTTLYAAVGAWGTVGGLLVAPYVAVPAAAAVLAEPYVRRIVRFEPRGDGHLYYRLPWLIPVLYLVLFVLRFGLELAIFGFALVTSFFLPTSIPVGLLLVLVGVDLLFGFSTGLLIGRTVGVYRGHADFEKAAASAPLPSAPPG